MIRISIVIPVYNVGLYLNKCIDNILIQDISRDEIEVIIVNDGSTDNSLEIAQEYQLKYGFINVLSQENAGLSETRNLGLRIAKGNFIWFIDSDDWIEQNCIGSCLAVCELYDLDIFSLDRIKVRLKKEQVIATSSEYMREVISGKVCMEENKFQIPAQLYIFRREFLLSHDLTFFPNIFHEDKEFILRAIYFANKFYFSGKPIYYHFERVGSITYTVNPKRCYDLIKISDLATDFIKENQITGLSKKNIIKNSFFALTLSAILAFSLKDQKIKRDIYKTLFKQKNIPWFVFKNEDFVIRLEALLFIISPKLFSLLYKIFK